MTAKEYLQQVYTISCRIKRLEKRREDIRADLYSLRSPSDLSGISVQTSPSGDKMAELVAKVDEIECDIVDELKELTDRKEAIIGNIELVPNERYKQILFDRYILCEKWEKIALDRDKTVRWIYRMHGKALNAFEKVLSSH